MSSQTPVSTPAPRSVPLRRVAGWGALALLGLWLLYLLAANVFLNSRVGDRVLNQRPERFHARWQWAMSLYPGHIDARGVVLGGHARRMRWEVSADAAHGRIRILPLFRRTVHFGHIQAGRARLTLGRAPDLAPRTPSTRAAGRPPWTLQFDAIDSRDIGRLQLWDWDVAGKGSARFGFRKQLRGGPFEMLPSRLQLRQATLMRRQRTWASGAELDLHMQMASHVPREVVGLAKLALVDGRLTLRGDGPGLRIREAADGRLDWQPSGNDGRLRADIALRKGELRAGSSVLLQAPLTIDNQRDPARRHDARVEVRNDTQGLALSVQVPRMQGLASFVDASLRIPGGTLDPHRLLEQARKADGRIALAWHFGSLRWINPLLTKGSWLHLDGAADVTADLRVENGQLAPGSTASIPQADWHASVQDSRFSGKARASAKVEPTRTTVQLFAERFALAPGQQPGRPYVRGNDLSLGLVSTRDLHTFREQMQAHLRFRDAVVPDLRAYNRFLPPDVRILAGAGTLSGDLGLDAQGLPSRARVQIRGRAASLRFGQSQLSGNAQVDATLHRRSGRQYAIDALQARVDGVRLASDARVAGWWANATLADGRFGWQVPLTLDGRVQVRMRDVSVLLGLFAERSVFPKWIARLIDDGQLTADARIGIDARQVIIDRLEARNARVELLARLRLRDTQPDGALYARWGHLGLGVEMDHGQRKLHLLGARDWYLRQPPLLK